MKNQKIIFFNQCEETIIIDSPKTNEIIKSPLIIKGKLRDICVEVNFPIILVNWDGKIIAESYSEAKDNWMSKNFVPFEAKLEFKNPSFPNIDISHFSHISL